MKASPAARRARSRAGARPHPGDGEPRVAPVAPTTTSTRGAARTTPPDGRRGTIAAPVAGDRRPGRAGGTARHSPAGAARAPRAPRVAAAGPALPAVRVGVRAARVLRRRRRTASGRSARPTTAVAVRADGTARARRPGPAAARRPGGAPEGDRIARRGPPTAPQRRRLPAIAGRAGRSCAPWASAARRRSAPPDERPSRRKRVGDAGSVPPTCNRRSRGSRAVTPTISCRA